MCSVPASHLALGRLPAMAPARRAIDETSAEVGRLGRLAAAGRLTELCGQGKSARTSAAVSLLLHAQAEGDTAVWIQPQGGALYPPDLAACGIDLDALVVVQIPSHAGAHAPCRAAELLLRSGAFGFFVIDLTETIPPGPPSAWQGRLLGLAREHQSRIILLSGTPGVQPSLGPLIGLRVDARRGTSQDHKGAARFEIEYEIVKNKSGAPLRVPPDLRAGPLP